LKGERHIPFNSREVPTSREKFGIKKPGLFDRSLRREGGGAVSGRKELLSKSKGGPQEITVKKEPRV